MCILFFKTNVNPKSGEYALILVNNRDEEYARPTLVSDFWKEASNIVGGRDCTPGKEGGTWLGMSSQGKIGVLLNVLQPVGEENAQAKGRGGLVTDYLKGDIGANEYLHSIYQDRRLYNNFNLVTIEAKPPFHNFLAVHYNNLTDEPPEQLETGIHGIGNSHSLTPWKKIVYGKEEFSKICEKYPNTQNKNELVDQLIGFLSNDTIHFPDQQLQKQGSGKSLTTLQRLSALFVKIPEINYGTRTNTVVLVDADGNVDYIEKTMKEPIDANNPQFITTRHEFKILEMC